MFTASWNVATEFKNESWTLFFIAQVDHRKRQNKSLNIYGRDLIISAL